ncbi:hypothetical protein F5Y18DRAFT_404367 [Xylariaceae sp. FL1019]|nr:hypothetical protein F5Y18DRAFT_404367 [Xylariaceae sp. FL1019]
MFPLRLLLFSLGVSLAVLQAEAHPTTRDSFRRKGPLFSYCSKPKLFGEKPIWMISICYTDGFEPDGDHADSFAAEEPQQEYQIVNAFSLEHVIANSNGKMVAQDEGNFSITCNGMKILNDTVLSADCGNGITTIDLESVGITNDNGIMTHAGKQACGYYSRPGHDSKIHAGDCMSLAPDLWLSS